MEGAPIVYMQSGLPDHFAYAKKVQWNLLHMQNSLADQIVRGTFCIPHLLRLHLVWMGTLILVCSFQAQASGLKKVFRYKSKPTGCSWICVCACIRAFTYTMYCSM